MANNNGITIRLMALPSQANKKSWCLCENIRMTQVRSGLVSCLLWKTVSSVVSEMCYRLVHLCSFHGPSNRLGLDEGISQHLSIMVINYPFRLQEAGEFGSGQEEESTSV